MSPSSAKQARTRRNKNRAKKAKANATAEAFSASKSSAVTSAPVSLDALLSEGQSALYRQDFPTAIKHLSHAAHSFPDNAPAYDALAHAYLEAGDPDSAETALRKAISLSDDTYERHLYLGQLAGNTIAAAGHFRRGIALLNIALTSASTDMENVQSRIELVCALVQAHCAHADALLGAIEDSNDPRLAVRFDADVERAVDSALSLTEFDNEGKKLQFELPTAVKVEPCLAKANLRLSQGRIEEAKGEMLRVKELLENALRKIRDENSTEESVREALEKLPEVPVRIAVGKQMIETGMYEDAVEILESVLLECDFNVEVWYLVAVAHWKNGDVEEARASLDSVKEVLKSPDGFDGELDEEMVEKLMSELEKLEKEKPRRNVEREEEDVEMGECER